MQESNQPILNELTLEKVKHLLKEDILILDTRLATTFTQGFIPGSIFIGLEGRFEEWAAIILPFDKKLILITEENKEVETITRLQKSGVTKIEGYLKGGFDTWQNAGEKVDMIIDVEADELAMDMPHDDKLVVVDVRREPEFADGHVKGAQNIPLSEMTDLATIANFEENENLYIHCAGGYRSVIASSLLKRHGIHNLRNILGGWGKIKEEKNIAKDKNASALN